MSVFEKFFEEMGSEMEKVDSPHAQTKMKEVMAKYGRNGTVGTATL